MARGLTDEEVFGIQPAADRVLTDLEAFGVPDRSQRGAGAARVRQTAQSTPTLEGMRDTIHQADMSALQYLQPGPDASTPEIALRRAAQVGVHGLSTLAQLPINALMGLGQGPAGAVTINPETGTMGLTPEAQTVVGFGARPMRFGGSTPSFVPPGTLDQRADLTGVRPVDPAMTARMAPASSVTSTGVPAPRPGPTVEAAASLPKTAAEAKRVANAYYKIADDAGGTLSPQFVNKFIDSIERIAPQTEAGAAVAGESEIIGLVRRMQDIRDKPMTLAAAQEVDEAIGGLITKQYGITGLSKEGLHLQEVQRGLRHQIENAEPGDIIGGTAGFDALTPARRAWSQARKMDELERIQQRADMTDNPATHVRTQLRTLVNNEKKSRGYSDDEIAALKAASERGVIGGALHVFGSRLMPIIVGAGGVAAGSVPEAITAAAAMHGISTALRAGASGIAEGRLSRARELVGSGVPPYPRNQLGP